MNFFTSRSRRNHRDAATERKAASRARLADPIAQAMNSGDRRSADVIWFGGMTFRAEGDAR
jgi:hypothetical protein